ncbi:MAG: hypothetical protein KGL39_34620 [Patescibacteria group bacterium]|nr:hypothetical protein [Patescibacteria group bacterium]
MPRKRNSLDFLQTAVANVFIDRQPELADLIRKLRAAGEPKSAVVTLVKRRTAHSQFMRNGLLTMVDELWKEGTAT